MRIARRNLVLFIFIVGLLIACIYYLFVMNKAIKPAEYQTERVIRYGFVIENNTSELIVDSELQAFLPLAKTPFQKRQTIDVNLAYKTSADSFGNEKLAVTLPNLPPYGSTQVVVTVKLSLASKPNFFELWHTDERFLRDEKFIEVSNTQISKTANSIQSDHKQTPLSSALHEWVALNIKNQGYIAQNLGALYALTHKKGDCTEYAYALTALARNSGIPAVPVAGFALTNQSAVLHPSDYHNWAYLFEKDEWVFSDPMKNIYNTHAEYHIVFNVLNEESLEANSQRFFSADPRLNIRML